MIEQYLDGLRLQSGPFGVPRIDPWFLDRAEIITGPASDALRRGLAEAASSTW